MAATSEPEIITATVVDAEKNEDDLVLEKLGYAQELRRGFNGLMSFSFCYSAVAVLASISILYGYGLGTGGPAVIIYGWLITSVMTMFIAMSLAEICSTYPSAGSVYHWAGMLATKEWAPFASYVTGWFNFLGNAAGDASFSFGFAQVVSTTIGITDSEFTNLQQVGVAIGVTTLWAIMNAARVDEMGWVNNFSALWQLAVTVTIVLTLSIGGSTRNTNDFVWTEVINETGFPDSNIAYVCLLGLLTSTFAFSGYEAGAHMAEETHNASKSAPWGIITTCIAVAITGVVYILGLLYSTLNVDEAINASNAAITTFVAACGTKTGKVLADLLVSNFFFAGFSSMTVTTRIAFAMARDEALPFSAFWRVINKTTQAPLRLVFLTYLLDVLLILFVLVDPKAFAAVTSITVIGFQISYAIPIFLRVTTARNTFQKKDFHLGSFGVPIGFIAGSWLVFTSLIFFWPTSTPTTKESMNYTCVVVGVVALIGGVFWAVYARHFFKGPKRDDDDEVEMVNMDEKDEKGVP